jgi:endonuclease/exonuclease/phosphatase family metal-dependent hydrolase
MRFFCCVATLSLAVYVLGCTTAPTPVAPDEVAIMTFNVQNLFDTVDDPGKDDKAYLPVEQKRSAEHVASCGKIEVPAWRSECLDLDWDEDMLAVKLSALADVIRQVSGGPDLIVFEEVEHASLLDRLASEYLADFGYGPAILIEGADERGIDVGILSRLPSRAEPVLHPLRFPDYAEREADTRGILEATFELPDGALLTAFAVHFPAPFHPPAMRELAYEQLNLLRRALPADRNVIAAGDFNTTSTETAATGILERQVRPYWTVAHETGCEDCRGTYYYARDDNWSFLDMILFSPARGADATWSIRADSVAVANATAAQRSTRNTPARFDPDTKTGVSDHWPLLVRIEATQKQ